MCGAHLLYAVGDSLEEAKAKLASQVEEYLFDALEGEDRAFAPALLLRCALVRDWVEYSALELRGRLHLPKLHAWATLFSAPIPPLPLS